MPQANKEAQVTGMVGIFWMKRDLSGFFHVYAIDAAVGQRYGDWMLSWEDHATLWDRLKDSGDLNSLQRKYREDYSKLPRGRVSYNNKTGLFTVYCGDWMNEFHKKLLLDRYGLDLSDTVFEYDGHYKI
jgi:hypothetical protein